MKIGAWRTILSLLIVFVFLVWVVVYVSGHRSEFLQLLHLPVRWVILAGIGLVLAIIANGLFLKLTLQGFEIRLSAREWFSISAAMSAVNYISPLRGGTAFRALYLRNRYGLRLVDFVTTMAGAFAVAMFVYSVLGCLALALLAFAGAPFDLPLFAFFLAVTVAMGAMTFQGITLRERQGLLLGPIIRIVNGWQLLRQDRAVFLALLGNGVFLFLANGLAFGAALRAVGVALDLKELLFYTASSGIAGLVALTPGALGVQEAMSIYMARTLPYDIPEALMAQFVVRGVMVVILALLAPWAFRQVGTTWSDAFRSRPE